MDMNYFRGEITRCYGALPKHLAESQNETDIKGWLDDGYISKDEYCELIKLNKLTYKAF